jgi:hypothetical protein
MGNYDVNNYKNDGARIQEFKKYQAIPDTTIEALEDFMFWYKYEYDMGDIDAAQEKENIQVMQKLIDTFLLRAGTQPEQHKQAEARLLEIWTKSCKGE